MKKICIFCGKPIHMLDYGYMDLSDEKAICASCLSRFSTGISRDAKTADYHHQLYHNIKTSEDYTKLPREDRYLLDERLGNNDDGFTQLLSTTDGLTGYEMTGYLGVISAEYTLGTGFLSSFDSSLADLAGGESETYTKKVHMAKMQALKRLQVVSAHLGGDGVIGIHVDLEVFSRDIIVASCYGTCVTLKKISD